MNILVLGWVNGGIIIEIGKMGRIGQNLNFLFGYISFNIRYLSEYMLVVRYINLEFLEMRLRQGICIFRIIYVYCLQVMGLDQSI